MYAIKLVWKRSFKLPSELLSNQPSLRFFENFFDHVPWILVGILILGIPTIIVHFIIDLGHGKKN
jgi:hypothetical protein